VLLWVCCQAENSSFQVAISQTCDAWMNNGVTSIDGYNSPDDSGQCFISFYGFSPWIGNDTRTFEQEWTYAMKYFIGYFYYSALVDGYSVHDSLNIASLNIFYTTYTSSILYTGYDLWWPGSEDPSQMTIDQYGLNLGQIRPFGLSGWYPRQFFNTSSPCYTKNSMQVFGDSSIYLFQPKITLSANYGSPTFYLDGTAHGTGNVNVWRKTYSVGTSVPAGYSFYRFSYGGYTYSSNPSNIPILNSGSLTVLFSPIPYRYLDVYSATGGYTSPSAGTHQYIYGQTAYVTAYANSGYTFDYWIFDFQYVVYSNPISVSMNVDHCVQPVFYGIPPPQQPPTTPSVDGPSSGYVGQSYSFSASSTDPDGDNIRYTFDWDDGTSTTTGYYSSGATAYASHSWSSVGQYLVSVTAQDSTGLYSGQSSPKAVTIQSQPTYSLTVTASDGGGYTLCPAVYVDGNYVGSAPVTVWVTPGLHTVYMQTPYVYWAFACFGDGSGNGASRQITSDTTHGTFINLPRFPPPTTFLFTQKAPV